MLYRRNEAKQMDRNTTVYFPCSITKSKKSIITTTIPSPLFPRSLEWEHYPWSRIIICVKTWIQLAHDFPCQKRL